MDNEQEKTGQIRQGTILFLPLIEFLELVYGKYALAKGYEEFAAQHPGVPSWKSVSKWYFGRQYVGPSRASSIKKTDKFAVVIKSYLGEIPEVFKGDEIVWRPYCEWVGMLLSKEFHPVLRRTWLGFVTADRDIALSDSIEEMNSLAFRRKIYESDLAIRLSSPTARKILIEGFSKATDLTDLAKTNAPSVGLCNYFVVYLRMMAWVLANHVHNYEQEAGALGAADLDPFLKAVPHFDETSREWTVPLKGLLEAVANAAGRPETVSTSGYLGQIWADSLPGSDPASKQRLIRNWMKDSPDKPDPSSVKGLIASVIPKLESAFLRDKGILSLAFSYAWMLRRLFALMEEAKVPEIVAREAFDAFREEYSLALDLMAKEPEGAPEPLPDAMADSDQSSPSSYASSQSSGRSSSPLDCQ